MEELKPSAIIYRENKSRHGPRTLVCYTSGLTCVEAKALTSALPSRVSGSFAIQRLTLCTGQRSREGDEGDRKSRTVGQIPMAPEAL